MKLPELRVRAAAVGDIAAVVELERGIAEAPHWNEADYGAILCGSGVRRCLLLADVGGELAGFAVGKVVVAGSEALAELESVAVRSDMRRKGVGSALCEAVAAWCLAQGAAELELEVRSCSIDALRLYERLGFESVGTRRAYYRDPDDDAVLMRLKLI
ncbi:ribosomal-protein-alanine N-acetyltransferase RimI [Edaphobacter acidisoli]|uniref:Ribosomal-protein-alanine N-acetyltransferase RimI n=1 Tax=Edaphobacter acidisoli TaxID=2040573 RepID=A0A916RFL6_9BACT|nr:GNAT family N-acetyltransferase [Edaphobacter acidisoli]GGA54735.1 ribosomal-protein-alanine N-acetyltransferase RimI [Edaphobacter acidisoli]